MANLTKAQLIEANPKAGLKLYMTKDQMLSVIKAAEKPAKKAETGKKGER
jgi:hypothetical protein